MQNTGNRPTANISWRSATGNTSAFTVGSCPSAAPGESGSLTVTLRSGLAPGSYSATFTFLVGGEQVSLTVRATVLHEVITIGNPQYVVSTDGLILNFSRQVTAVQLGA